MPIIRPYVPTYITVHLGAPSSNAQNVVVSFQNYIKNVASSEIYPTWDESALYANIYAQISYALNRVYTEFYRSQGYNFDITSSTAYDQKFISGRNIFDNISRIVDDIFNDYIRRIGFLEPLAAKYCNGTTVTCEGLSQWGSQNLAEQGLNSVEILYNYYGDNIEIVRNAPIQDVLSSYPGFPLQRGSNGASVSVIQTELNFISQSYPAIPKVYPVDGIFGEKTEKSVRAFQNVFNLTSDGIVGKGTWYKLVYLYTGLKRLSELNSQGQQIFGISLAYPDAVSLGDRGEKVTISQFILNIIRSFYSNLPAINIDGYYGEETKKAVEDFQRNNGLTVNGVINDQTWEIMYRQYKGIVDTVMATKRLNVPQVKQYPGTVLQLGSRGEDVRQLQEYINVIYLAYPQISSVNPTGFYGNNTRQSVIDFQRFSGLPQTGTVDEETWNRLTDLYLDVFSGKNASPAQFPGYDMSLGDKDDNIL